MLGKEVAPDRTILRQINQRLARAGMGSGSRITAAVHNGHVTLSGSIQYETQRRPVMRAVDGVDGVRGLTDQLQVQSGRGY